MEHILADIHITITLVRFGGRAMDILLGCHTMRFVRV